MDNLSDIFSVLWKTAPDWLKVVVGGASGCIYLYTKYLKPKVYKDAIKGGITISEANLIAEKKGVLIEDIENIKFDLFEAQQDYMREEIKTFRYSLRDKFEEILTDRMSNYKCPKDKCECPQRDFIYASSVNTCIGLLLTVSVKVYRRMENIVRSESYVKDNSSLKKLASHLAGGFADIGKDTVRDFYPPNSVIPLDEGLKYFDKYIIDEMQSLVYNMLKELNSLRDAAYDKINTITSKHDKEVAEMYGGSGE